MRLNHKNLTYLFFIFSCKPNCSKEKSENNFQSKLNIVEIKENIIKDKSPTEKVIEELKSLEIKENIIKDKSPTEKVIEELKSLEIKENIIKDKSPTEKVIEELKSLEVNSKSSKLEGKKEKQKNKMIELYEIGISEKGITFGIGKYIKDKNEINLGISYLDSDVFSFIPAKIDNQPIKIENLGLKANYKRFLNSKYSKNNFYLSLGVEASRFNVSSTRDLTKETYINNGINVSCSACGNLILSNESDQLIVIPSVMFGYKRLISEKLAFNLNAGIQYFNLPEISWQTDTKYPPPSYVSERIDEIVSEINETAKGISDYIPTIYLSVSYLF